MDQDCRESKMKDLPTSANGRFAPRKDIHCEAFDLIVTNWNGIGRMGTN